MSHLDNLVADALAQSPDTVVHQLATDRERLRGELSQAQGELEQCQIALTPNQNKEAEHGN